VILDADQVARDVVEPDQPAFAALVERFGPDIVGPDGRLDRPKLAEIAFATDDGTADLNAIVHPAVGAELVRRLEDAASRDGVLILDVPLLVESGRDDMVGTIVVDTDPDIAVARLVEHRGFTESDARARMARQASREERLAKADFVISNDGSPDDLVAQIDACWAWISSLG
jgi:dephospho-CoA kinase